MEDVIIIGAGPCGLSAAVEFQQKRVHPLVIEKGCITNSVYGFPTYMQFFSTPDLLEIGNVPFIISKDKPTRQDALEYYRQVALRKKLRIHTYEKVLRVTGGDGDFTVHTENRVREKVKYKTKKVIVATGYFDNPNKLGIPGEDLPKVSHYFKEAHPYQGLEVAVIGGNNNAVEASMALEGVGAKVTLIYRGGDYSENIKPWVLPVFKSIVNKERIQVLWNSHVKEINEFSLIVQQQDQNKEIRNDFVFALTGYLPNRKLLQSMGVEVNSDTGEPVHDPQTMETNVRGIYVAGVIAAGFNANRIFIENGRFHGGVIARGLTGQNSGFF